MSLILEWNIPIKILCFTKLFKYYSVIFLLNIFGNYAYFFAILIYLVGISFCNKIRFCNNSPYNS